MLMFFLFFLLFSVVFCARVGALDVTVNGIDLAGAQSNLPVAVMLSRSCSAENMPQKSSADSVFGDYRVLASITWPPRPTEGETAKTLLREQLELLATTLEHLSEDCHRPDAERLLIQGRFPAERFPKAELVV